jgi:peptidoglycan LD-endopeptidase CwlK
VDSRSERNLKDVHPVLQKIIRSAMDDSPVRFIVIEGRRALQRQREMVKAGASQTMNSRHLTGHAVDVAAMVGGKVRWDWPLYAKIAAHVKDVARALGYTIEWGGDWRTFKDGPHFQLSKREYP